jgi:signal transduction histidine kinase/DNA-binding NarL/FixJ family response regulator
MRRENRMLRLDAPPASSPFGERSEHGYVALASLARRLPTARSWSDLASTVAEALGDRELASVRLWAQAADGLREVACAPEGADLPDLPALDLERAAAASEPSERPDGSVLVGLHADGMTFGVVEVRGEPDHDLVAALVALVACRVAVLAGQGIGDVQLHPSAVGGTSDASGVIANFARQAKRLLDHDRLSVYLLSHDGRAFERFAVATSEIVPGEGVLIPFGDVGLRHILLTNKPIVSSDLGADPRLIGAEDRVIARAGFRGLLSVPLRHDGRPFGVLNFVSHKAGFYRNEDIPIAEQIADQIAAFVENLRLQRRAQAFVRREAGDRERSRLARDLYQAVAHSLGEIADVAGTLDGDTGAAIGATAQRGLADVRRAIVDLDPTGLDAGGLTEMVAQALDRLRDRTGCAVELETDGDPSDLPASVARSAYRIVQEALMNVRLHANAKNVRVELSAERDLALSIEDDGAGFQPREAMRTAGLGLRHMRERTDALGGFLSIASEPGSGTTIRLKVPHAREAAADVPPPAPAAEAPPQDAVLRVFVAESNMLVRSGIERVIDADDEMRIVGDARTLDEAKARLRQLQPDVALVSTALAKDGVEALVEEVQAASPLSAILAVAHGDSSQDAKLIAAGATGVIDLGVEEDGLAQAVRSVACGTRVLGGSRRVSAGDDDPGEALTAREQSILTLVARGETNAEIGRTLYLATKTVERQVATIVRKLRARNRAHAAAIGVARHIVELSG